MDAWTGGMEFLVLVRCAFVQPVGVVGLQTEVVGGIRPKTRQRHLYRHCACAVRYRSGARRGVTEFGGGAPRDLAGGVPRIIGIDRAADSRAFWLYVRRRTSRHIGYHDIWFEDIYDSRFVYSIADINLMCFGIDRQPAERLEGAFGRTRQSALIFPACIELVDSRWRVFGYVDVTVAIYRQALFTAYPNSLKGSARRARHPTDERVLFKYCRFEDIHRFIFINDHHVAI